MNNKQTLSLFIESVQSLEPTVNEVDLSRAISAAKYITNYKAGDDVDKLEMHSKMLVKSMTAMLQPTEKYSNEYDALDLILGKQNDKKAVYKDTLDLLDDKYLDATETNPVEKFGRDGTSNNVYSYSKLNFRFVVPEKFTSSYMLAYRNTYGFDIVGNRPQLQKAIGAFETFLADMFTTNVKTVLKLLDAKQKLPNLTSSGATSEVGIKAKAISIDPTVFVVSIELKLLADNSDNATDNTGKFFLDVEDSINKLAEKIFDSEINSVNR